MNKLLFCIQLLLFISCFSCKDNSPTQKQVDNYRAGIISEDSLLTYVSDSVRVNDTFDWASRNQSKDDIAAWLLGRAYKIGLGVECNPLKAKSYYISACKKGNVNAMSGLANMYVTYPGQENLDSAFYWYNEAARHGDPDAYFFLCGIEINRETTDTIRVVKYLQKGIALNSYLCIATMADLYYTGDYNTTVDKSKAYNMLKLIPKNKLDDAANYLLGEMYESGEGTNQNFSAAFSYYKKSAEQGNTNAMCKLGNFYHYGQGIEKNDSLAFIEYQKAANAGNVWGMRCVGVCYHNGRGVKTDVSNAWHWYKTAAKLGDIESQKYCNQHNVNYLE